VDDGSASVRPERLFCGLGAVIEERQVNDESNQKDSSMEAQNLMVGVGGNSDSTGEEEDIGAAKVG
jgi:hypothetical protein